MKRTLLFIACVLTSLTMLAQGEVNEYRPLVEEGKHWTYDNFMPARPAKYDHYYYYDLKGDTLIAGKNCIKMYSENQNNDNIVKYVGALYEENKKVYCFFPEKDEAILLYDFDCKVGDKLNVSTGQMVVKDIRNEDNGGISIRKYTLLHTYVVDEDIDYREEYEIKWIEGVGAMEDFFAMVPLSGNYNSLNACELNGEKLYQTIEPDLTEEGYHKMAIEGKRWNYIHYYLDENGEHRDPYSYVVRGDTVIRRTTYKKLWYQDENTERLVCLLFETGREVLKSIDFDDNSYDMPIMTSFFVFDRNDFGRVFTWKAQNAPGNTNWMVYGVDTIEVKGQPFRRYTCLQKYSEEGETLSTIEYDGEGVWHDIWVEGVGSASSGIEDQNPYGEPPMKSTNDYTYFVSCYENGECVFTADDFNIPTSVKEKLYRPFVEEGKVWQVGAVGTGNPVQWVEYYYFDGDTIVDGKTCKQMWCQRFVSPDSPDYSTLTQTPSLSKVGAWYEEDKKVYVCREGTQGMEMLYDFSLEANDTLILNDYQPYYIVGPKQIGGLKGFKGIYRDIMLCGQDIYITTWLEGVGGIDGPLRNVYPETESEPQFLMSCTVGDEVIYLNDEYEDGATPGEANAPKRRFDFTHTTKLQPKAPIKRAMSDAYINSSEREVARPKVKVPTRRSEAEQSLYGEYNDVQLGINLDPLEEAYVVRITDETGKTVYDKTINAGNIVGLNIDISGYAAGLYTVIVENSNETFTGEFETRTTGIKDVRCKMEEVSGHIYNLQGQRLSSLQRGLNIVNGKKVFVK